MLLSMRIVTLCALVLLVTGGAVPASARVQVLRDHDALLGALLRPHRAGTRYRFGPRLTDLADLSAQSITLQNRALLGQLGFLRTLSLHRSRVGDLRPLATFRRLERLDLGHTDVRSVAPLAALPRLAELSLAFTSVTDLAPLRRCVALRALDLTGTAVPDLSALAGLTLDRLTLGRRGPGPLLDASPLAAVDTVIVAEAPPGVDLTPLARVKVRRLVLDGQPVRSLRGLEGHATLAELSLRRTAVPVAEVRALLRASPRVAVVLPDGRRVGRTITYVLVRPDPRDFPCLRGGPPCESDYFGPVKRPVERFVMP